MTKPTHITDYLERNARAIGHKPALVCADRNLTWRELGDEVLRITPGFLLDRGTHGDGRQRVVGLLLPNSWEFVVAYLAILRAGHIVLPLDPTMKRLEIEAMVSQLRPDMLVTDQAHLGDVTGFEAVQFEDLAAAVPGSGVSGAGRDVPVNGGAGRMAAGTPAGRLAADKQVATLLFTSGTTGRPKAVPYTHANHVWNIAVVSELWQWTADDTILLSLPLSHWHGLVMGLMGALYHGNTLYLKARLDAEDTLKTLASGKISLFMHVPAAYLKLVNHAPDQTYDLSRVRLFVSGSSYLPPAIWQQFTDRFGVEILERYGSSETGLVASNALDDRRPGFVGRLLPGVELKAQDDGELLLRSPGLFPGYYRNEAATKDKVVGDGWWKTGDIGVFHGDVLQLKGRIQEKIKKLSYTVYPRDLEWALLKNPKVREVVAMGIQLPDRLDDLIVFFVVGDIPENEVAAYCKANMPAAWRPDRIIVLPEIPKTRSGKPVLARLRQIA